MLKKVLVLDNDQRILDVMQEALNYEGFDVDVYDGTDDILKLIKKCKPDLLIVDYILNGINGGELCRSVKNCSITKNLPVIIFSAYPKVLQSLGFYGCNAFISKPFDLSELIDKVTDLVTVQQKSGINAGVNKY